MSPLPIAVVTGASRGIGRAIALKFSQSGFRVWALARSKDALEALQKEAHGTSPTEVTIQPLVVDATNRQALLDAAQKILSDGIPSVLVNNAGVAPSAPLSKTDLSQYDEMMALNTTAPLILCQALMPAMAQAKAGRVINIASTAALKGFKYTSAYCASKHALLGLTRALAVEFASKGVTVNAVCPGWTDTSMLLQSAKAISRATGRSEEDARKTLAQMNPMGKLISPDDVAQLCLFLTSNAAATVTGSVYSIDGGEVA